MFFWGKSPNIKKYVILYNNEGNEVCVLKIVKCTSSFKTAIVFTYFSKYIYIHVLIIT